MQQMMKIEHSQYYQYYYQYGHYQEFIKQVLSIHYVNCLTLPWPLLIRCFVLVLRLHMYLIGVAHRTDAMNENKNIRSRHIQYLTCGDARFDLWWGSESTSGKPPSSIPPYPRLLLNARCWNVALTFVVLENSSPDLYLFFASITKFISTSL